MLGTAIGAIFTRNPTIAAAAGYIFYMAVRTVYWAEQNSNGSLDAWIPYANLITFPTLGIIEMKIGDSWYIF